MEMRTIESLRSKNPIEVMVSVLGMRPKEIARQIHAFDTNISTWRHDHQPIPEHRLRQLEELTVQTLNRIEKSFHDVPAASALTQHVRDQIKSGLFQGPYETT